MFVQGTHRAQQERESRGYQWFWSAQPTNPPVTPIFPPGTLVRRQDIPLDHPPSRFGTGRQGPNVASPGTNHDALIQGQNVPLDHPPPRFVAGIQGPNVAPPPHFARLIQGQNVPLDHPPPRFLSSGQWINVSPPGQTHDVLIQGQAVPLDHPTPKFGSGIQGPNVRPPVSDMIRTVQELPDFPRHPRSSPLLFMPSIQNQNVASQEMIGRIVTTQELPFHPPPFFFAGHHPVEYEEWQFFIVA